MATEYKICTLSDFLRVPDDKLLDCLGDFIHFLDLTRNAERLDCEITAALGAPVGAVKINADEFIWVDDGVSGISALDFTTKETDEFIGRMGLSPNVK